MYISEHTYVYGGMKKDIKISVVSPVYRGEKMVSELVRRNVEVLTQMRLDYEIILVNDASPDESWREIVKECRKNPNVKGVNLSRNFGQHYAITAGLAYTSGDWVVVMDCDLQNPPEEIPNLYKKAQEGYDIVYARRVEKQFGWWKKKTSAWYHSVFNWLSDRNTDASVAEFGIYSQQVIAEYNKMPEYNRYFSALIDYLGFKTGTVDVVHSDRMEGESSYTLSKLIKLASDSLISCSNKPLKIAVHVGFAISLLSGLLAVYNVIAYFFDTAIVRGYTTTIFSIWFATGMILSMLGILGLYIGKIFDQVKGRPYYIVKETMNFNN